MLDTAILSVFISAAVAIIVSLISFYTTRRSMRQERESLERRLQRNFTERLYDRRLEAYPLAFDVTDSLRGEYLFNSNLDVQDLRKIREQLLEWNRKHGFVMSDEAIRAFYELRASLDLEPETNLSKTKRKSIFRAKNKFRGILRSDVSLLYDEEREDRTSLKQDGG